MNFYKGGKMGKRGEKRGFKKYLYTFLLYKTIFKASFFPPFTHFSPHTLFKDSLFIN